VLWRNVSTAIFDYVPAYRRLFYAAKVRGLAEQEWLPSPYGFGLLWREAPRLYPRRCINYSGGVRLDRLAFPRLHILSLEPLRHRAWRDETQQTEQQPNDLSKLIGPRLERLSCTMGHLLDLPLLARLDDVRPPLRELLVGRSGQSHNIVEQYLPKLPDYLADTVEKLSLRGDVELSINALAPLAHSKTLQHFPLCDQWGDLPPDEAVAAAFTPRPYCGDDVTEPFVALKALEIRCTCNTVALLARSALRTLQSLRLTIWDSEGRVRLGSVTSCEHLRALHVVIQASARLSADDLVTMVQGLPHLTELTVNLGGWHEPIDFIGFDDKQCAALAAALPNAETLRLQGDCDILPVAFAIVRGHCRKLRELALHQRVC
jgi:hypothetical protein